MRGNVLSPTKNLKKIFQIFQIFDASFRKSLKINEKERSRRDSNPRYGFKAVQRFSKPSPSATRPQLLIPNGFQPRVGRRLTIFEEAS